ncbi:hypothetical protein ACSAZK_00545 [Methanosarcina sp. Mfa9]|uniref:hypothetical protein n=1 Tax=Methanosarcina sp. Mfa9 TaxID=3439063 RepID=UPI003F835CB0
MLSVREMRMLRNKKQGDKKIKAARQELRVQKKMHLAKLSEHRKHLRAMVMKQNSAAKTQTDKKADIVDPIIAGNREKLELRKLGSRTGAMRKGRLILAYPIIPSNAFSECTANPPKNKMVPDLLYAEMVKKGKKISLVPDQDFADLWNFCQKICLGKDAFKQRSNMLDRAKQRERMQQKKPLLGYSYRRYTAGCRLRRGRVL